MVHIHNGKYSAIKKNTFESVLMRWRKLEPIIQSEGSQKEKHQFRRESKSRVRTKQRKLTTAV